MTDDDIWASMHASLPLADAARDERDANIEALWGPLERPGVQAPATGEALSLSAWNATLPFPLASILRCYEATQDPVARYEFLLYFFEALAQFAATVLLSAWRDDAVVYEAFKRDVVKGRAPTHASFGTWNAYGQYLAKRTTKLLTSSDAQAWQRRFRTTQRDWVAAIASAKLFGPLRLAALYRNKKAHGARLAGHVLASRLEHLEKALAKTQRLIGRSFESVRLVSPGPAQIGAIYLYREARVLRGPDRLPNQESLESATPMRADRLYLLAPGGEEPLALVPFIRVERDPGELDLTCYFYSRIEDSEDNPRMFWTSYHTANEELPFEPDQGLLALFEEMAGAVRREAEA